MTGAAGAGPPLPSISRRQVFGADARAHSPRRSEFLHLKLGVYRREALYLDSINWTIAGRKVELIKEDDQLI